MYWVLIECPWIKAGWYSGAWFVYKYLPIKSPLTVPCPNRSGSYNSFYSKIWFCRNATHPCITRECTRIFAVDSVDIKECLLKGISRNLLGHYSHWKQPILSYLSMKMPCLNWWLCRKNCREFLRIHSVYPLQKRKTHSQKRVSFHDTKLHLLHGLQFLWKRKCEERCLYHYS